MRTEAAVKAEILEARRIRHESDGNLTEKAAGAGASSIRDLMAELSEILTAGAVDCPGCGKKPHGNHKQVARYAEAGAGVLVQEVPDIYVVRCLHCEPERVIEDETLNPDQTTKQVRVRIVLPSSRGETSAEAVALWNAGVRIQNREILTVPV